MRLLRIVVLGLVLGASSAFAQSPSAEVVALRQQGQQAIEASQFADADAAFSRLVTLTPTDPLAHMHLGMARAMGGRPDLAIAPLREALRLRSDLLPAQLFLGLAYLDGNKPAEALPLLTTVVKADPTNANARQALVQALMTLDRIADALPHLRVLSREAPKSPQIWAALGRSYEQVARAAFDRLQDADPDSPYVWLLAADVLVVQEKYPVAFSLLRKAQTALPDLPGVHAQLARVYAASGHADWAEVEQTRATRAASPCPSRPVACAYLSGKLEETLAQTETSTVPAARYWRARAANDLAAKAFGTLETLPPSVELHVVRAAIARDQEDPIAAAEQLREALKLAPGDRGLEVELAGALLAARDLTNAVPLLEKLHAAEPSAPDIAGALGDALLQGQQVERALPLLKQAVEADPSNLPAQGSLGRALLQSGDAVGAAARLEQALPADTDGSLFYQLAQALQRTGQTDRVPALLAEYQKRAAAAAPQPTSTEDASTITAPVP